MTPQTRRWILAGGGVAVVAIVILGIVLVWPDSPTPARSASTGAATTTTQAAKPTAVTVADEFLRNVRTGDAQAAGALTDDPATASAKLAEVRTGLNPTELGAVRPNSADPEPNATTLDSIVRFSWKFGPERRWDYDSTLPLVKTGDQWRVHWTPALLHPKLTADRKLALVGPTEQAAVVDRDGNPLLVWQGSGLKAVDESVAPLLRPGMQRVVGDQQAGKGAWHIALLDPAGAELESLYTAPGGETKPIVSTLSVRTQQAAQAAVDSVRQGAMLVAIQPSNGEILAVAQNAAAGSSPFALNGGYPAGSTFKIATAAAVIESGAATVDTVLPCPGQQSIGQRTISNDDHFELPNLPLHSAFAHSCNTTFAKLAGGLAPDALSSAATQLGINADFEVPGFTTEAGKVVPAGSTTQRVEDSIGQGNVQVSPFGMALMSATVASGRAVTPKLWRGLDTKVTAGYQPPPGNVVANLRAMMREVVTDGTATKNLSARSGVSGKTGTAQFGDGKHSHGWFTGFRGDLAFAILVIGGESSSVAVSLTAKFLA